MTLLEFYGNLRQELIAEISGVKDAKFSLYWDDTKSNYRTRNDLVEIYNRYLAKAAKFGMFVVTRHCDCPNPKHEDYVMSNRYGLEITYRDESYNWPGGQMYQGDCNCVCPCTGCNEPVEHQIIEDIIYRKDADQNVCEALEGVMGDIHTAIENAGDKRPRSSIREYLLRAIIQINDQVLPLPMDAYINHQMILAAGKQVG